MKMLVHEAYVSRRFRPKLQAALKEEVAKLNPFIHPEVLTTHNSVQVWAEKPIDEVMEMYLAGFVQGIIRSSLISYSEKRT